MQTNLSIDGERLWASIGASAAIGRGPNGGLRRLTLTDDDKRMRDLFAQWVAERGFALGSTGSATCSRAATAPILIWRRC